MAEIISINIFILPSDFQVEVPDPTVARRRVWFLSLEKVVCGDYVGSLDSFVSYQRSST